MTELEAIKWFEDLIVQTDDVFPECSEALQAELIEQRKVAEVAIEALRAQQYRQNGGWISVKDRLPNPRVWDKNPATVLAAKQGICGLIICVARWNGTEWVEHGKEITVIHWMPLPEPPKEDAE